MKNSVNLYADLFSVLSVLKMKLKLSPDRKFGIALIVGEATPMKGGRDCSI